MEPSPRRRGGAIYAAALALWLGFTALFIATYPLNTAGDSITYVSMIVQMKSNLTFASGYPFVIGHLLRQVEPQPAAADVALWDAAGPVDAAQMATLLKIFLIQHAVHAAVVAGCSLLLLRAFGSLVAVTVVFLWGMSTFFMSFVSTAFPEWLQADAVFATVCLCAVGFFGDSRRKKALLYLAAGAMFGVAFLCKYNSPLFGLLFVVLLLHETMPWRQRLWTVFGGAAAFALVTGYHFFYFHHPTTRARGFQYESGWLFMEQLDAFFGNDALEGSSAINTLRYRALARVIPPDYTFAHAFWSVDDGAPPEVRASYRAVYDRIMAMPRAELVEFIDRRPRPDAFRLWVSAVPLYHYIGLEEGNELATRVYLEFVRDNPLRVAAAVARGVAGTSISGKARPLVTLDPGADGLQPAGTLASAHEAYVPAPTQSPLSLRYWSPRLILWQPGLRLFKAAHAWRPTPALELGAYLVVLAGIVFRRADREKTFAAAMLLALLGFVVASNAVHPFRHKEAIAAWPIACLLWAIAIKWTAEAVSAARVRLGRREAAWPSRAAQVSCVLALTAMLALPGAAYAQPAEPAGDLLVPVRSMGKPPVWKPFTGAYYGLDRTGDESASGGGGYLGLYKDLMPSIVGVGVSGEAYVGGYAGLAGVDGGVRALAELRSLFLKAGVDHDFHRDDTSFVLSLTVPLRRGGILGRGTHFRVDWLPGRGNSWNFGVQVPLEPHMGRTRPRDTEVDVPRARRPPAASLPPEAARAMREVRQAALRMTLLNSVFWRDHRSDRLKSLETSRTEMIEFKKRVAETDPLRPRGARMENEQAILHEQLDLAFGLAAGAPAADAPRRGAPIAAVARGTLLEEILYPYNRLFGQYKRPEELWGLAARARQRFAARRTEVDGSAGEAVRLVFEDYLGAVEELRAWAFKQTLADSRVVWLPFQLALRPEEHDSQEEIDAILSRAQRSPLAGGNHVFYWNGQQWQLTLRRSILDARDYHVLWLHDYDGVDHAGDPDVIGYFITVEGYLKALAERVREFDRTGRLPTYMILVDLNYWEANKGRLYTDLLQDPLRARASLPRRGAEENRRMQAGVERALADLRAAVAGSKRLQEEAARRGQDWLRKYVAVHLSVMNPADFSYRTSRLVGYLPIAPDTMVRDHRKIIFYDLTELDPGRGAAIYGGVGVGEQYASATWEDRAVWLAGPAALTVKAAARRYLEQNGFKPDDIPPPLRALPMPADYARRVAELEDGGWTARAMEVHNDRGFAQKDASVASAVLYTLMPPGSLIVVPDSIWTHELWAAQLVGAALRGCHVYVIAPAAENAPSAGFPQLSRTREIWSRFIEARRILGPEIADRGGQLRVGLYTREAGVDDLQAQLGEMHRSFERYPFLKEEFPFPEDVYASVGRAETLLAAAGYRPAEDRLPEDARARSPKLHRKTQLFITRETLAAVVRDQRTQDVIANQLRFMAKQGIVFDRDELARTGIGRAHVFDPYLDVIRDLPEPLRRRTVMYMTVGSLNKDARGMMTDGEVLQVTAGAWAVWAVADMWMLTGSTTWIETQEDLDRLLPPYKQWQRRIGRWVRKVI
jgi:hypothetical protein